MSSKDPVTLEEIWICPPMAFARFGQSATPMENFSWQENNYDARSTAQTEIQPELTFEIGPTGAITRAYVPDEIHFRDPPVPGSDQRNWRPVSPFFELHGRLSDGYEGVLTTNHLDKLGLTAGDIRWKVKTANRKAYHYTLDKGDWIKAKVKVRGDDYVKQTLTGVSKKPSDTAILTGKASINLGAVQVIKATSDFPEIRIRITPPAGLIHAPTNTSERDLSALVAPNQSDSDFLEKVVTNLNPKSPWASWNPEPPGQPADYRTSPGGLYAQEPDGISLGFLDDSGDGLIKVSVPGTEEPLTAFARFTCCPQDFQPDRRPFVSIADGLSDQVNREEVLDPCYINGDNWAATEAEIGDLMQRVRETMEASNIDQQNLRSVLANAYGVPAPFEAQKARIGKPLPLTQSGRAHHARFLAYEVFKQFAAQDPERFIGIIRDPTAEPADYNSKMPAVMRGSDSTPMALSQRQHLLLMAWLKEIQKP